jgi:hypothetical protein
MSPFLCRDTRYALSYWKPFDGRELPERIALHMDDCPRCSDTFNHLFIPIRLMRRARSSRFRDVSLLAAAAALMLFPISWQPAHAHPEVDEVSIQPEQSEACALLPEEIELCDPLDEGLSPA